MSSVYAHFDLDKRLEGLESFEELTCLDLGCGPYNSEVAKQVLALPWKKLVSVDGYKPSIDQATSKEKACAEWFGIVDDVREFDPEEQFDVVVSFDVLEHLPKEDGWKWLEKLEKIAKKRVVLFFPVEPDDFHRDMKYTDDPDNLLEEHVSHWKGHELASKGYKIDEINSCHSEKRPDGSDVTFGAVWAIKNLE